MLLLGLAAIGLGQAWISQITAGGIAAAIHARGGRDRTCSARFSRGSSPPVSRIGIVQWGSAEDQLDAARGAAEDLLHVGCGYPGRYLARGWHEATLRVRLRGWTHGNATVHA